MSEHTLSLVSFIVSCVTCALNIGLIWWVWWERRSDG